MHKAAGIFVEWQLVLEDEPELFSLRLLNCCRGYVWRNRATREYYVQHGFPGAPLLEWGAIRKMLGRQELQSINAITAAAFHTTEPVSHTHTSQMPGCAPCSSHTDYLAVYGTIMHGVVLARLRPLTSPPSQIVQVQFQPQTCPSRPLTA
jgi:hypothetical protein